MLHIPHLHALLHDLAVVFMTICVLGMLYPHTRTFPDE